MTAAQSDSIAGRFETLSSEYQICRRKLESKCEALLILSKELDQCRSERDQFKLMAEQLRDRYQIVKRQLTGDAPPSDSLYLKEINAKTVSDIQSQGLTRLLFDTKEYNKSLKFEADDLRQKLQDAEGDIKLLREQIARTRVGTTDEGLNTRHFPAHEREDLVRQLEASREEFIQLERDLQQVIDEKEELVTERDAYRTKYERLNTELNYILRGDDKRIVDIDALSMENKFLQERSKQMEEEKSMAIATVTKYKNILEKKKTKGILKLGQSRSGGLVITQKQVQQMVQGKSTITPTPQALADLQGLCAALLDTINDKNLALSHQRKTNKLLGSRVSELEKKLKTLEVSGLWSVSGNVNNLEKLKAECEEIKTLVPRQFSQSSEASETPRDFSDLDSELSTSRNNSVTGSPFRTNSVTKELSRLDLEELDLLPTKEEVVRCEDVMAGVKLGPGMASPSHSIDLADQHLLHDNVKRGMFDVEKERTTTSDSMTYDWKFSMRECLTQEDVDAKLIRDKICCHDDDEEDLEDDLGDEDGSLGKLLKESRAHNGGDNDNDLGDDGCDEDGDDNETSEHLRSLMDCVTTKLLQRSQQQQQQQQLGMSGNSPSNYSQTCPGDVGGSSGGGRCGDENGVVISGGGGRCGDEDGVRISDGSGGGGGEDVQCEGDESSSTSTSSFPTSYLPGNPTFNSNSFHEKTNGNGSGRERDEVVEDTTALLSNGGAVTDDCGSEGGGGVNGNGEPPQSRVVDC